MVGMLTYSFHVSIPSVAILAVNLGSAHRAHWLRRARTGMAFGW